MPIMGHTRPICHLLAKAREDGATYIYGVLTGYKEAPEGVTMGAGQYYNKYMEGNKIAMAAPLSDGIVEYEDDAPQTMEQYSKDVSTFLMWAAEPEYGRCANVRVLKLYFS